MTFGVKVVDKSNLVLTVELSFFAYRKLYEYDSNKYKNAAEDFSWSEGLV